MTKRISEPALAKLRELYKDFPDAAKIEIEDTKHCLKYSITRNSENQKPSKNEIISLF